MTTRSPPGDHDRTAALDTAALDIVFLFRSLEQLSKKIDDVGHATNELKVEVGGVKARLFNGLSETTRETYAKVLILESKHEDAEIRTHDIQKDLIEKFSVHDTRDRFDHILIGTTLAFMLTALIVLAGLQWDNYAVPKVLAGERKQVESNGWSPIGP